MEAYLFGWYLVVAILFVSSLIFNLWQKSELKEEKYQLDCSLDRFQKIKDQYVDLSTRHVDLKKEFEEYRSKYSDKKVNSYEVTELLHDLTMGNAIVEIRRVEPTNLFIRSPMGDR